MRRQKSFLCFQERILQFTFNALGRGSLDEIMTDLDILAAGIDLEHTKYIKKMPDKYEVPLSEDLCSSSLQAVTLSEKSKNWELGQRGPVAWSNKA